MSDYPFEIVSYEREEELDVKSLLQKRPFIKAANSFEKDAKHFVPGKQLEIAINTAIAVGEPLLITGEPGTGKTQTAYYVAEKLNIKPVLHFQVKSDSSARDLLYSFDSVRYFHDAYFRQGELPDKAAYVEPKDLWHAIDSSYPRVLLIDEIDKAPRDFPNDLLHELDKMEFTVVETNRLIQLTKKENHPLVFITSNSERRLPDAFLRRCVYHHIRFDKNIVRQAVASRREEYENLSEDFIKLALKRFEALRNSKLRKLPSTSELLVWLQVLTTTLKTSQELLESEDLSKTPHLGVLLKDQQDIEEISSQ
jgi:MoxR-like ATPase